MALGEKSKLLGGSTSSTIESGGQQEKGVGKVGAFIQMLQGNLGPGILTLPYAFTVGGTVITAVMLCLVGGCTLYSMQLVLMSKRSLHMSERWRQEKEINRPQSFQAVGRELLGPVGERVIIVFVVLMQLGICAVFLNYAAENLVAVEDYFLSNDNATCLETPGDLVPPFDGDFPPEQGPCHPKGALSKEIIVVAATPIALLLSIGRSALLITIATTCATLIMYTAIGTILVLVMYHFHHSFPGIKNVEIWPEDATELPIVFGSLVYTVTTSVGILVPIQDSMTAAARQSYTSVVNAAIGTAVILFLAVGLLSNFAFGVQSEASITSEFIRSNIGDATYISVVNIFLALSVLLTYPLQFRPASQVVESACGLPTNEPDEENNLTLQEEVDNRTFWQRFGFLFVRGGLVVATAAFAALVPQLDLVVSFAGSFTSCILAMVIPPLMDFSTMQREGHFPKIRVALNTLVMICGVGGMLGGTGATLLEMMHIPFPGKSKSNSTGFNMLPIMY
eukprot:m.340895 g.340895  ORF g.340895 m.340895 type:complete len:508 (+) comp19626_c0_seq1:380-1903(+)